MNMVAYRYGPPPKGFGPRPTIRACSPRMSRQTTDPARLKPFGDSEIEKVPVTLPAVFRPASNANVRV